MARPFRMSDTGAAQTVKSERGQVEQHPVSGSVCKKARVFAVIRQEGVEEIRSNFIGPLTDTRSDDGSDTRALGAKLFHRVEGRLQHTVNASAPPCMCRADNTCLWV